MILLGSYDLSAGGLQLIGGAALSASTQLNVRFCNRNPDTVAVQLAIGTGGAPAAADYLDYNTQVFRALEDTGIVCSSGEKIWVLSDTANTSVRVFGFPTAGGVLGSADLTAATPALLFTAAQAATVNIRICNRNKFPVNARIALGTGGAAAAKDWISYDAPVRSNGFIEELGIAVASGEKLWVQSDFSNVSARAHYM